MTFRGSNSDTNSALISSWDVLDPPVSLLQGYSGSQLPVAAQSNMGTVSVRGVAQMDQQQKAGQRSRFAEAVTCETHRAIAEASSDKISGIATVSEGGGHGNIVLYANNKTGTNVGKESSQKNMNQDPQGNVVLLDKLCVLGESSESKMDKSDITDEIPTVCNLDTACTKEHIHEKHSDDPVRAQTQNEVQVDKEVAAIGEEKHRKTSPIPAEDNSVASSAAMYVSSHPRGQSSHDFAGEFQDHVTNSRRARSEIRTQAVMLIDRYDSEASSILKHDIAVSHVCSDDLGEERANEEENKEIVHVEKGSKTKLTKSAGKSKIANSSDNVALQIKTKGTSHVVENKETTKNKSTFVKPPKGAKSHQTKSLTSASSKSGNDSRNSSAVSSKKTNSRNSNHKPDSIASKTELNDDKELEQQTEETYNSPDEPNTTTLSKNAENADICASPDEATNAGSNVPVPAGTNGFRLQLDDTAVYPGIMSERFYREFRRDRFRTAPPPSIEPDTATQQKALLDLMSKGLGNFTTQMADILVERIKPEYETLARRVGEEVKEAAIAELQTLRTDIESKDAALEELRMEKTVLVEQHDKEVETLKKSLEAEKQKRLKEFTEYTEKIEKLMLAVEKVNNVLKEKDKIVQKAMIKAKQEEQKRVKMEEEHAAGIKQLQKEVEKAKCEISVIKAKKRIQSALKKDKAATTLVSHHGMHARQLKMEDIPYDEGDD